MSIDLSKILAIDPPGCGCTECIIGEYIPIDSPYIDEVFEAVLDGTITPRNNQNNGTLIIYRMSNGRVTHTIDSTMLRRSDFVLIAPIDIYIDEDAEDVVDVSTLEDKYEDDEEKLSELITSIVNGEVTASNPTYDTYIAYRSPYGETGIIELPGVQNEEDVSILLYDD